MSSSSNHPLSSYADPASGAPVFCLRAMPQFSPLDVNVAFLARSGWNQSVDRLRFHIQNESEIAPAHPIAQVMRRLDPHLLIRRFDRDEDRFISVHAYVQGEIVILSNDVDFAHGYFQGIFLSAPLRSIRQRNSISPRNGKPMPKQRAFSLACWQAPKAGIHLTIFRTTSSNHSTKPNGRLRLPTTVLALRCRDELLKPSSSSGFNAY